MIPLRSSARVTVCLIAVLPVLCSSIVIAQDDPALLVTQLPTNDSVSDGKIEARIVGLGTLALPALEQELRPGIRFKTLNELLKADGSRRYAVVRVLAQIPGEGSTDLLVRSLSDPPDNYAMTLTALGALARRTLAPDQIIALLGNQNPEIVLAGMDHADATTSVPEIKAVIERLFDMDAARAQFRNEYGAALANADILWELRLTAGKALDRDMLPEIRVRAAEILAELEREALQPTEPDKAVKISYASQAEQTICSCLNRLHSLGQPVKDLVEDAAKTAEGNHAKVLDMALARLGDQTRVAKVAEHLATADSPTVRFCAAITLRSLRDKSSILALRKALRDPYQRQDGSCLRIGDGMIHPIRVVAADALVDLGEDPKTVRAEMKK
jgi:hypothetical protein